MTWVRLDDAVYDSPKLRRVTHRARWVWVAGIAYANRHLTDGVIAQGMLGVLDATARDAQELVGAGLWEPAADGWQIHDYTEYQASRDEINGHRSERSEQARRAANIRWHGNADA